MESRNLSKEEFHIRKVTFRLTHHVDFGCSVCIVGDGDKLGDWTKKGIIKMEYNEIDQWTKTFNINEIDPKLMFKFLVLDKEGKFEWSGSTDKIYDLDSIKKYLEKHKEKWGTGNEIEIKSNEALVLRYLRKEKEIVAMEDFHNYQDGRDPNIYDQEKSKQIEEDKNQDNKNALVNHSVADEKFSTGSKPKDEVKEEVDQDESKLKHWTHCEYKEDDQILTLEVNVNAQENLQENVISSVVTQLLNNYKNCKYFNIELKDSCKISQFNLEEVKISEIQTDIKELTINFSSYENIEIENLNLIILTILKCMKELKIRELIFNGISRSILTKLLKDEENNCFSHITFLRVENLKDDPYDDLTIKTDITSLKCVSLYNISKWEDLKSAFSKAIRNVEILEKE